MPTDTCTTSLHVRVGLSGAFALDVAFEAPPGVTVLFGRSGAGKSTTLACVAGLVRPSSGHIAVGGETWFDADRHLDVAVHRRRVAFVFQSLALFPHMTAAQNVAYGMSKDLDRTTRRSQAYTLLERLRVDHLAKRKPATFSGGEAQRVALARALATRPRVLLLDEPFSALDRGLRRRLLTDVRTFVRELSVPVLLVTHQREDAHALGEHLVVLEQGRVEHTGPIEDLEREDLERELGG